MHVKKKYASYEGMSEEDLASCVFAIEPGWACVVNFGFGFENSWVC